MWLLNSQLHGSALEMQNAHEVARGGNEDKCVPYAVMKDKFLPFIKNSSQRIQQSAGDKEDEPEHRSVHGVRLEDKHA